MIVSDQVDDPKTGLSRSCTKSVHLPKSENLISESNHRKKAVLWMFSIFSIQSIKNSQKLFVKFNRQQFIEKSFIPNGGDSVFPYIWAVLSRN